MPYQMEIILPRENVLCIAYSHQSPVSPSEFLVITILAIKTGRSTIVPPISGRKYYCQLRNYWPNFRIKSFFCESHQKAFPKVILHTPGMVPGNNGIK